LGVVFCLDFSPFFFLLLLFPCHVFFLHLFIYFKNEISPIGNFF
jgi:hypothetical protein